MNLLLSPRRRRGVALVITLIMLSVVTITAVAFLAMSRRERASVGAASDHADAKLMAETALARAQANLAGRMMGLVQGPQLPAELQANTDRFPSAPAFISDAGRIARSDFGFLVSTNWQTPIPDPRNPNAVVQRVTQALQADASGSAAAFDDRLSRTNILYAPFLRVNNQSSAYKALLRSLYYDPRVPVFTTKSGLGNTLNSSSIPDDQFYLDLNRNGKYDTNGYTQPVDRNGRPMLKEPLLATFGDPEWIGVLERPDEPHSGNNRFIGRIAYFVQPVGRTLDLNFIHNSAKGRGYISARNAYTQLAAGADRGFADDGFYRNQGLGSWELNLAGLLVDLNTNLWPGPASTLTSSRAPYSYFSTAAGAGNSGQAFADATILYRRNRDFVFQSSLSSALLGSTAPSASFASLTDRTADSDLYANGPVLLTYNDIINSRTRLASARDRIDSALDWPGSDSAGIYADIFQLVNPNFLTNSSLSVSLLGKTPGLVNTGNSTYDSGTFYRLAESIGSDTPDARFESGVDFRGIYYRRAKLNLNYAQDLANTNAQRQVDVTRGFERPGGSNAPFSSWAPLDWFTNTVDRLVKQQIETNGLVTEVRRAATSTTPARAAIDSVVLRGYGHFATHGLDRIEYSARPHQLFQLAANIYESTHFDAVDYQGSTLTTNRRAATPVTYRPTFYFEPVRNSALFPNGGFTNQSGSGVLRLAGFQEVTDPTLALRQPWLDPANLPAGLTSLYTRENPATNFNVYGVPWVVGTKRGFPTFDEAFWQTSIDVTRRVRAIKTAAAPLAIGQLPGLGASRQLQLQYIIHVTNHMGADAINSYSQVFTRPNTRVMATNILEYRFGYRPGGPRVPGGAVVQRTFADYIPLDAATFRTVVSTNYLANTWNQDPRVLLQGAWGNNFLLLPTAGRPQIYPEAATNRIWAAAHDRNVQYVDVAVETRNRLVYALVDESQVPHRILDFVNLESRTEQTDLLGFLQYPAPTSLALNPGLTGLNSGVEVTPAELWLQPPVGVYTRGLDNQLRVSLGQLGARDWNSRAPGSNFQPDSITTNQVEGLNFFLYGTIPPNSALSDPEVRRAFEGPNVQLGYNPTHTIHITDRRMANDPLVHYTMEDLGPGTTVSSLPQQYMEIVLPGVAIGGRIPLADDLNGRQAAPTRAFVTNQIGLRFKPVSMRAPWGVEPRLLGARPGPSDTNSIAFDLAYKDPLIRTLDDWVFPVGKMASLGQLGRIHRGTPWQTIYMKAAMPGGLTTRLAKLAADKGEGLPVVPTIAGRYLKTLPDGSSAKQWMAWAGNAYTRPENDWMIFDLFTTALNENAARGLLSVNNTNQAAWSAVLSGVPVISDRSVPLESTIGHTVANTRTPVIEPGSKALTAIVESINETRASQNRVGGHFLHLGDVFGAPSLTAGANEFVQDGSASYAARGQSPYLAPFNPAFGLPLRPGGEPQVARVPDEVIERIPQQIAGLLRQDEPKFVVYAFGQSLKPAPGAILTAPGLFFGLCTNYVVTGEYSTRSVVRFDGSPTEPLNSGDLANRFRPVVEDHRALPPPR